ncbi:MAG: ABC transporter permease [Clostridia bacterium]|nr:ABC transporter permease [Clostridia bacterium]
MSSNKYHTHISSKHKLFSLNLKETWKYRDLIWLFTKRTLFVSYKQTILGPLWIFLNPLVSSLLYAFVFGGMAGLSPAGVPTILFYLTSNAIWIFFSSCVNQNASTFTANAGVFGKVYFPRLTVPISNMISAIIQFFVQMLLVVGFMVYYLIVGQVSPIWWAWSLIPVALLHLGMFGLGVGLIVSSMTTKYRDLSILVTFGVSLWMYITPVVYGLPADGALRTVMLINPVTQPMELIRYAILGQGTILPLWYGISAGVTLLVLLFGIMIFNKVERNFMDTV